MKNKIIMWLMLLPAFTFGAVQIRLPDTTVVAGTTVQIPVYVDNSLTGLNVFSYQLQISFYESGLNPVGLLKTGTMTASWGDPLFNRQSGMITFIAAGSSALVGKGKLVYLVCQTLSTSSTPINFTGSAYNFLNEGIPALTFDNGYVYKTSPPTITISPDNAILAKGETQQFQVSGSVTTPVTWGITNSAICLINGTGLLTATAAGTTRVFCQDAAGLKDTTGIIEIRPVKVTLPQSTGWQLQMVSIPVIITSTTGAGILSGEIEYTFSQSILTPVELVLTGSLLQNTGETILNTSQPGKIMVNFATSTPLSGEGNLFFIKFQVADITSGSTNLTFSKALFNESTLGKTVNGSFSLNYSNISFNPNTASLIAGNQVEVTVSGGTPPYVWSSTTEGVVSIGNFGGGNIATVTAIGGGTTKIKVTDAVGIQKLSGDYVVFDIELKIYSTSIPINSTAMVPVIISDPPVNKYIYSLEIQFQCDGNYLEFWGIDKNNSLTSSWEVFSSVNGNKMTVVGASSAPVTSNGILFYLFMYAKPNLPVGTTAYININTALFNEGSPNAKLVNGNVTGAPAFPDIQVTPLSFTEGLLSGATVTRQITVGNTGIHNLIFGAEVNYDLIAQETLVVNIPDSPGKYEYDHNTLVENDWHIFTIPDSGTILSCIISYTWETDTWPYEGSFWIANNDAGMVQIATNEWNGNHTHTIPELAHNNVNNNWAIWIQDTYGDGGHKASNIQLTLQKTNEPQYSWLTLNHPDSIVEPGTNASIDLIFNTTGLTPGTYSAEIVITSNDSDEPEVVIPVSLVVTEAVADMIPLNSGWNLISLDVIPENNTPAGIFTSLIGEDKLVYVSGFQNQEGVFFDPYGPDFLNTLINMNPGEGYWVKVNLPSTLFVEGTPIPPNFAINLKAGWNLIGYWLPDPIPPESAFQQLIDLGILVYVSGFQNQEGVFFDPYGPDFLNTLLFLKNGEGYWVKMSEDYEGFTYPSNE